MMFRARSLLLTGASLVFVALASACPPPAGDDDDDDDDDGGEGEGEGGDAERLVDAALTYLERCEISFIDADSFGTQAEPILFDALLGDFDALFRDALLAQFQSDAVIINGAAVDACIAAIGAAPCGDELPENVDACDQAIQGTLDIGDSCGFDTDCAGEGTSCFVVGDDECGTCRAEAGEDEDCTAAECADDLVCVDGTCVPGGPDVEDFVVGDPCDPNGEECDILSTGLACVDNGAGANECVPAVVVQVGETCDTQTQQRYCENGASTNFCVDDGTGTGVGECTARPGPGEPCLLGVLCDATEGVCDDGTCEIGGAAGDGCDEANPVSCQVGLRCGDDGTCGPLFTPEPPPQCGA